MKKIAQGFVYLMFFILLFTASNDLSGQNALDFDGIDDRISAPNATALISGGNISLATWVYPTNPTAGWPNFDGFVGFRNDANADFYMLQLSSTSIEVRFRNSTGTNYTIAYPGLQLNSWNHFVMTYNGSLLHIYHNGVPVDSIPASGSITSTTGAFHMGTLPFGNTDFDLDGRLEDVGLWSRALSASDVNTLYNACSINLSDNALQLCYQFNQGTGGGSNVGITTATDSKGNINGNLSGFSLSGTTSNFITYGNPTAFTLNDTAACTYLSPSGSQTWTASGTYMDTLTNAAGCDSLITVNLFIDAAANSDTISPITCGSYTSPSGMYTWMSSGTYMDTLLASSGCDSILTINLTVDPHTMATLTDTACVSYLSPSGNHVWTTSGTYFDTIPNMTGCDSALTINLTVVGVDTSVSLTGNTLTANATNASYQWLNCNSNFQAIPNATSASFTPGASGNYAVAVTQGGCTDTSACTAVVLTARDLSGSLQVAVHPNPHQGQFAIDLPAVFAETQATIFDPSGKKIAQYDFHNQMKLQMEIPAPPGIYFVYLQADDLRSVLKVLKHEH